VTETVTRLCGQKRAGQKRRPQGAFLCHCSGVWPSPRLMISRASNTAFLVIALQRLHLRSWSVRSPWQGLFPAWWVGDYGQWHSLNAFKRYDIRSRAGGPVVVEYYLDAVELSIIGQLPSSRLLAG